MGAVLLANAREHSVTPAKHDSDGTKACKTIEPTLSESADVHAVKAYEEWIAELLKQQRFEDLDCVANSARVGKLRFPGGAWKLHSIYAGLAEPEPGKHATEEDWKNHFTVLEHWVAARPDSITARVALADSYAEYAWAARGDGYSDTVTDNGWKLMGERLEKAKSLLDEATTLTTKCPEWYRVMLQIALGQGWEQEQESELFHQAVASEPDYYYYYQAQALFLLPKWNGEDGDSSKFAEESANRIGGSQGDELYFRIAQKDVCACNQPEFNHFSFPRIQHGFEEAEKEYGLSIVDLNTLALMAIKSSDYIAADEAFKRIGDNWDRDTWRTEAYFNQNKTWATASAPRLRAERNALSAEGKQYIADVERRLAPVLAHCMEEPSRDPAKFHLLIQIAQDGSPEKPGLIEPGAMSSCVVGELLRARDRHDILFPPPPQPSYWLFVELDPSAFSATAR